MDSIAAVLSTTLQQVILLFLLALTLLLTAVLLMGLVRRERFGLGNIGFESILVIGLYVGALLLLLFDP